MNVWRCPCGLTSLCRVVRGAVFEASSVVGVSADADCPMCAASCIGGGASGGPNGGGSSSGGGGALCASSSSLESYGTSVLGAGSSFSSPGALSDEA
eukprot:6112283-Prymnesium_polylepis.1